MINSVELHQKQQPQATSWQVQNSRLLQLSGSDLETYLKELLLENPLVDPDSGSVPVPAPEELSLSHPIFREKSVHSATTADLPELAAPDTRSLIDHVLRQIQLRWSGNDRVLTTYLAGFLDENGYLSPTFPIICRRSPYSDRELRRALSLLQQLEPAGVGASDLRECLLLQAPAAWTLERKIIEHHLQELAYGSLPQLAKELEVSAAHLEHALVNIRTLSPKPGQQYTADMPVHYVTPDYYVYRNTSGALAFLPAFRYELKTNSVYEAMLHSTDDPELRAYLQNKLTQLQLIQAGLQNREKLIDRIVEFLLSYQERFFYYGPSALHSLKMKELADFLEVSESTISRAVSGKYLSCSLGTFPLKQFFVRPVATRSGTISTREAKAVLQSTINAEPPNDPYSDSRLASVLQERGIRLARRTVTKYREALGIPDYLLRRQQKACHALPQR